MLGLRLRRWAVNHHRWLVPVLPRGYRAYAFAGGRIYLDARESPMMLARALGVYEPEKVSVLLELVRPGMTFVDVGCNKGDFALIAAHHMGDTGQVHAVEPSADNAHWIRRSIERNGYGSVHLHELALSDVDGTATLHLGERSGWHTLVPGVRDPKVGAIEVPTRRLDGLAAAEGLSTIDVIKIDVEGAEDKVLAGAVHVLSGEHPMAILLDLHPPIVDPSAIGATLASHGFRLYHPASPNVELEVIPADAHELVALRGAW